MWAGALLVMRPPQNLVPCCAWSRRACEPLLPLFESPMAPGTDHTPVTSGKVEVGGPACGILLG